MILHHAKHATLHWPLHLLFGLLDPLPFDVSCFEESSLEWKRLVEISEGGLL